MRRLVKGVFFLASVLLLLAPGAAWAQSAISGTVTDTTGAIMPGVTVEAASPALIEKVRAAVTDSQGRYTIANLRPGTYSVTFTLSGFSTTKRDGVELPADFTATINAELKIGALEETITVSGSSPVVDTREATRSQVLSKDMLELIPSSRTSQGTGAIIPGVKLSSPDMGGSGMMQNVTMTVHGLGGGNNVIQVDGMLVNTNQSDGSVQMYHNDMMAEEMAYQTTSLNAEVSGGGVRLNMIPRQGGNTFSGLAWLGGAPGSWVDQSIPASITTQFPTFKSTTSITHIYDFNFGEGGPLVKDRLWFFGSFRRNSVNNVIANNFYPDGQPAVEDQWIMNPSLRFTGQLTSTNKLTVYYDRALKQKGHELTLSSGSVSNPSGVDILTASTTRPWNHGLYYTEEVKWTSVPSNRVLSEVGFARTNEYHTILCQPGITQPRDSAAWFANAPRVDLVALTTTTACTNGDRVETPIRNIAQGSVAYVTGTHAFKTGLQWSFGPDYQQRTGNADQVLQFRNGAPDSVQVWDTPVADNEYVKADLGIYAQDAWTIKRLTLNLGGRYEHFNSRINAVDQPAGRWVPAHVFPEHDNLPNWNDVAPRLGAAYDLFGNGKTAIKGSVNKYMTQWTGGFARRYTATNYTATDQRNWTDVNGDGQAQGDLNACAINPYPSTACEVGPSNITNFGGNAGRQPADNLKRTYNLESSVSLQQELLPGVSVSASYYHRHITLEGQDNTLATTSDYTAFQIADPTGNGQSITVFNLNKAKQGAVALVDRNSSINHADYNGFEVGFMGRLPNGANMFGGWSVERTIAVTCDGDNSFSVIPSRTLEATNPNVLRYCDQSGKTHQDLGANVVPPFQHEFKFAGSYPLVAKVSLSATLLSYAGKPLNNTYVVPTAAFAGVGGRTQSVTVPLNAPFSQFYDRWNQLDLGVRRPFKFGRLQATAQFDVFNALNSHVVLTQNTSFGGSTYGQPQSMLLGRMFRVSTSLKF